MAIDFPSELRARFEAFVGGKNVTEVVSYCGSGVTVCYNGRAMEVAGIRGARLYPGSWSEWCADESRPGLNPGAHMCARVQNNNPQLFHKHSLP